MQFYYLFKVKTKKAKFVKFSRSDLLTYPANILTTQNYFSLNKFLVVQNFKITNGINKTINSFNFGSL